MEIPETAQDKVSRPFVYLSDSFQEGRKGELVRLRIVAESSRERTEQALTELTRKALRFSRFERVIALSETGPLCGARSE